MPIALPCGLDTQPRKSPYPAAVAALTSWKRSVVRRTSRASGEVEASWPPMWPEAHPVRDSAASPIRAPCRIRMASSLASAVEVGVEHADLDDPVDRQLVAVGHA